MAYQKTTRKKSLLITIWNAFGWSLILAFFVFTAIIGGSAGLGYQEGGRYFVGNHGDYTEVSQTVWKISSVLEILFWIFIPLEFLGSWILEKLQKRKYLK